LQRWDILLHFNLESSQRWSSYFNKLYRFLDRDIWYNLVYHFSTIFQSHCRIFKEYLVYNKKYILFGKLRFFGIIKRILYFLDFWGRIHTDLTKLVYPLNTSFKGDPCPDQLTPLIKTRILIRGVYKFPQITGQLT